MSNATEFPLNWLLTLAYDGTDYAGWQRQPNATTVQEVLGKTFRKFYSCDLPLYGTSRTDAGVHALHQHVTLHVPELPPIPIQDVFRGLNKLLPKDIRALALVEKEPGFHARYEAVGKAYTYLIHRGPLVTPFLGRYMWTLRYSLDVDAMRAAAAQMIGTHDFTTFGASTRTTGHSPNPVKTLHRIEIKELDQVLMITVIGNSFLYKMVRRIVGHLVNVGRAQLPVDSTRRFLTEHVGYDGIETAMAHGLFLDRVFFDRDAMLAYERTTMPFMDLV